MALQGSIKVFEVADGAEEEKEEAAHGPISLLVSI